MDCAPAIAESRVERSGGNDDRTNPKIDNIKDKTQIGPKIDDALFLLVMIIAMALITVLLQWKRENEDKKRCYSMMIYSDDAPQQQQEQEKEPKSDVSIKRKVISKKNTLKAGMRSEEEGYYKNLFPKRQLFQPKLEYPLWHDNWDGRASLWPITGVTRHLLLIRHGQYEQWEEEDHRQVLTPLGRKQADLTGQRIAELIKGVDETFRPCNVKILRVSNMARARETADIIATHIPDVERAEPDPLLNEGWPAHHIPGQNDRCIKDVDEDHPRIEKAFQKYFHRASHTEIDKMEVRAALNDDGKLKPHPKHEFEVIVCHANVIRYFFCRGLQIPPEAWLRLSAFNCSLTYLDISSRGNVCGKMFGDVGHLPYELSTNSKLCGYDW